jgi:drug/metabolite transporter (DMT)-like permease
MSNLLALGAASLYGVADFAGGLATRRLPAWRVTAWSQILAIPFLVCGVLITGWTSIDLDDVVFGAIGGVLGLVGIVALYGALSEGTMSIVSPMTGVLTATLTVTWGLVSGETIDAVQWMGIVMAVSAVVLIAANRTDTRMTRTVFAKTMIASVGFAGFFIAFAQTSQDAGLVPLAVGRGLSVPVAFLIAASVRTAARPPNDSVGIVVLSGNADVAANIAIVIALQRGPLGISSVLVSLYPMFTVLAAMLILGERPTIPQRLGIILAVVAAALLVV